MVTKVLGGLDRDAGLHARLRYASATPRPRWPALSAGAITRRAAMIPAMLWPGWTLRLLPRLPGGSAADGDAPLSASCGSFRRGCASYLLLPGGPPQLNFERASPLLGNHSYGTDRTALERIIYRERDLTPLASVLAQLAYALDEHGGPIDYARRRALFTGPESVALDQDACTRLRLQHGWSRSYAPRLAVQRWYLLMLLTGEHLVISGARKPFSWHCGNFRYSAPGPLRAFLRQQAEINLARHGINEPVTWEPPADWAPGQPGPASSPASLAGGDARRCAGRERLRARGGQRSHADCRARPALLRGCRYWPATRHRQRPGRLSGPGRSPKPGPAPGTLRAPEPARDRDRRPGRLRHRHHPQAAADSTACPSGPPTAGRRRGRGSPANGCTASTPSSCAASTHSRASAASPRLT